MTSIFPNPIDGGLEIRDGSGDPIVNPTVEDAYVPGPDFEMTCTPTALPSDCFSKFTNRQANAIVSELICLAEYWSPTGIWDCASLCNLSEAFQAWEAAFVGGGGGGDVCLSPISDGQEEDASLIYCDGLGNTFKFPLFGETSLLESLFVAICSATAGNANQVADALIYCDGDGVLRKVASTTYQLYRGPWFQTSGYAVNQMVQREGRLWSPNAVIPPGTAWAEGSAGATWYEVSPTIGEAYDPALGYAEDTIITRNGNFYAANEDIAPGTPFAVGSSGQTWREVDFFEAFINEFNPAKLYTQNTVVTLNGNIYRATAGPVPSGPFDPADWELLGGENNLYRGQWLLANSYETTQMVLNNRKLYTPNAAIPAATPFVIGTAGATWSEVSSYDIEEFSAAESYLTGNVRTYLGGTYRALVDVLPGPFNPASWEAISGDRSIYRGQWVLANEYQNGDMVLHTDSLYVANDDIPSGTPFAVNTVGPTFRPVGTTLAPIVENFNIASAYVGYELVVNTDDMTGNEALYRTGPLGHAPGPFNTDFIPIGERNLYRGLRQARDYKTGDVVYGGFIDGGSGEFISEFYRLLSDIPDTNVDDPFDSADFTPMSKTRGVFNAVYAYSIGDIVFTSNGVFRANDDIPAATAFTTGVTGATWAPQNNVPIITVGGTAINALANMWNAYVILDGVGAKTFTVPTNASIPFPIGTTIAVCSINGQTTIVAAGGVTIFTPDTLVMSNTDYATATLTKVGTDVWHLAGNLV